MLLIAVSLVAALLSSPPIASDMPLLDADPSCAPTKEQLIANRSLTFQEFDQTGVTPFTPRKLGERGCNLAAFAATEDYLMYGPEADHYQRSVMTWHMAQFLALAGREREAATLAALSRRPEEPSVDQFDWNTYVLGTRAFLLRDRPLLDEAVATLSAAPGVRNQMNSAVLRRFQTCFDKSYFDAYTTDACKAR